MEVWKNVIDMGGMVEKGRDDNEEGIGLGEE